MAILAPAFSSSDLALNIRTLRAPLSGVQRYILELNSRIGVAAIRISPSGSAQGLLGHLWEQTILPIRCRGRLLFSPGNTGPILYRRQVVTIHDTSTFDCPDAFTGVFARWYRWLLPRLAGRALGVITVSEFSRERIVATLKVPRDRVAVVYNGVTHPTSIPSFERLTAARLELRLPTRFLLFVGSMDPRKNLPLLLKAFTDAELAGVSLVIAGGGNERLFAAHKNGAGVSGVMTLGHVNDEILDDLYALAEGFVFPSRYEGFGLPPLEAMIRGCPVLCSNASSLPEICGPAFDKGGAPIYFTPSSVDSISAALREFAALPREARARMALAGRNWAARFSWDQCASDTLAALGKFGFCNNQLPSKGGARPVLDGAERPL